MQNFYCKKLNGALKAKEKKKNRSKKKILNNGMGRVMTNESTVQALQAQEAARIAEMEEKEHKRAQRELKRGCNKEIDQLWVREGDEHAKRVAEWAEKCVKLKAEGA